MIKLDLGCLENDYAVHGYIGIDNGSMDFDCTHPDIFAHIAQLPFKDKSVDIIRSSHCLFLYTKEKEFKEVLRVLKHGGTLILRLPDYELPVKKLLRYFTFDSSCVGVFDEIDFYMTLDVSLTRK